MLDNKKFQWDESYKRQENFIINPKEEVVKFLSRYVKKRQPDGSFVNLLSDKKIKGLDFGCGIGRQVILFEEYGIDGYGVDISTEALKQAISLSSTFGFKLAGRFTELSDTNLPFEDNSFDIVVCDSVLDSMAADLSLRIVSELDRVTNGYAYFNLISSTTEGGLVGDSVVESEHEKGTIQSYFDVDRIKGMFKNTSFDLVQLHQVTCEDLLSGNLHSRFHVVVSNKVKG